MMQQQLSSLLVILALVGLSSGDYRVGVMLLTVEFLPPNNTLFDGSCCDSSCGSSATCCAAATCSPTFRYCFRESNHSMEDIESCPLFQINRNNPFLTSFSFSNPVVERYYTGGFQLYLRVSYFTQEADFEPPFSDPLADNLYLEFKVPAVEFGDTPVNQMIDKAGEFGRVMVRIQTNVHCAENWNGSACEIFCLNGNCNQVYEPPSPTTATPLTVTTPASPSQGQVSPTESDNSVVGIAVGVAVGGVVLLLVVAGIIAAACCLMRKSRKTASYTIRKRMPQKSEIQVVPNSQDPPSESPAVYAVVNKNKAKNLAQTDDSFSSDESGDEGVPSQVPPAPPKYPPPPYLARDGYVPMDASAIYTNVLHHEIEEESF